MRVWYPKPRYADSLFLHVCALVMILVLSQVISYWTATIGHPVALWWWRDILGVLP